MEIKNLCKPKFFFVMLIALGLIIIEKAKAEIRFDSLKYDKNISLRIEMDSCILFFQKKLPYKIILTVNKKKEVIDLETAKIKVTVIEYRQEGSKVFNSEFGGTDHFYSSESNGILEYSYKRIEQKRVFLTPGKKLEKEFELYSSLGRPLDIARYELIVNYEDKAVAKTIFKVFTNYEHNIPSIIASIEKKELHHGVPPLSLFYILTGNPAAYDSIRFQYNNHASYLESIRDWWNENKKLAIQMNQFLSLKVNANYQFNVAIPTLIGDLKSEHLDKRIKARDSLFSLTGIPTWVPSSNDSPEKVNMEVSAIEEWWHKNEKMIAWINNLHKMQDFNSENCFNIKK